MNWTVDFMYIILLTSAFGTSMVVYWYFGWEILEWAGYLNIKYYFVKAVLFFWICPVVPVLGFAGKEVFQDEWRWDLPGDTVALVTFSRIFLLVWICGAGIFLTRYIRELLMLRKIRKDADCCEDEVLQCFFEMAGSGTKVSVGKSSLIHTPRLTGALHPRILLPDRSYTDEELRVIFRHELIHVRHRDILAKNISAIVRAIHFFNPVSWWFLKALNRWCEYACDYEACVHENDMKHYFSVILDMVEEDMGGNMLVSGLAESGGELRERMNHVKRSCKEERLKGLAVFMIGVMLWYSVRTMITLAHVLANLI